VAFALLLACGAALSKVATTGKRRVMNDE